MTSPMRAPGGRVHQLVKLQSTTYHPQNGTQKVKKIRAAHLPAGRLMQGAEARHAVMSGPPLPATQQSLGHRFCIVNILKA